MGEEGEVNGPFGLNQIKIKCVLVILLRTGCVVVSSLMLVGLHILLYVVQDAQSLFCIVFLF